MDNNKEPLFLHCTNHRECYYQFISLEKENTQNRLLCSECLLPEEKCNAKKELINIIPLSIAIKSPKSFLKWLQTNSSSEYIDRLDQFAEKDLEKEFNEQTSKFDQMIKVIEQLKQQAQKQLDQYKNLQIQFKQYSHSFFEKINYNKLRYLLFQLQELDKQFKSDQYTIVAKELTKTIDEMLKDNCALISKEIDLIQQDYTKIIVNLQRKKDDQLQKQIIQLFEQYEQYLNKLNEDVCAKKSFSQLLTNFYFNTLEQKIVRDYKKQIKQKNLIYLGSRDGLNKDAFWSKVNGKKQLLMIFKSKNNGNYIFGGYSPCQWQANLNNYVQDDTLTSFLFSQTHNQIYPLKQDCKKYAIWSGQGYGPTFGGGNDIYINPDFSQGCSKLGHSYYWDQYKDQKSEHLFGGAQPNISECEIYEILFA